MRHATPAETPATWPRPVLFVTCPLPPVPSVPNAAISLETAPLTRLRVPDPRLCHQYTRGVLARTCRLKPPLTLLKPAGTGIARGATLGQAAHGVMCAPSVPVPTQAHCATIAPVPNPNPPHYAPTHTHTHSPAQTPTLPPLPLTLSCTHSDCYLNQSVQYHRDPYLTSPYLTSHPYTVRYLTPVTSPSFPPPPLIVAPGPPPPGPPPVIAPGPPPVVAPWPPPIVAPGPPHAVAPGPPPVVAPWPPPIVAPGPPPVIAPGPPPVVAPRPHPVVAPGPPPVVAPRPHPVVALGPPPVIAPRPHPVVALRPHPVVVAPPPTVAPLQVSTPLNHLRLRSLLRSHPDPDTSSALVHAFQFGFHIGFDGPRSSCISPNLGSAFSHPEVVDRLLAKEVELGHTIGPFLNPPFDFIRCSGLGVVPKDGSDWRLIFHLSAPAGDSINDYISPD